MFLGRLKQKKEPKSVFNSFLYIFTGLDEPNQQDSGCVYKHNYVHDFQGHFSFFKNHTAETFLIFKDSTGTVGVMDLVSLNAIQNSCTKPTD